MSTISQPRTPVNGHPNADAPAQGLGIRCVNAATYLQHMGLPENTPTEILARMLPPHLRVAEISIKRPRRYVCDHELADEIDELEAEYRRRGEQLRIWKREIADRMRQLIRQ